MSKAPSHNVSCVLVKINFRGNESTHQCIRFSPFRFPDSAHHWTLSKTDIMWHYRVLFSRFSRPLLRIAVEWFSFFFFVPAFEERDTVLLIFDVGTFLGCIFFRTSNGKIGLITNVKQKTQTNNSPIAVGCSPSCILPSFTMWRHVLTFMLINLSFLLDHSSPAVDLMPLIRQKGAAVLDSLGKPKP